MVYPQHDLKAEMINNVAYIYNPKKKQEQNELPWAKSVKSSIRRTELRLVSTQAASARQEGR